ncbi:unnamed protein product [marine sediment metagenome]|uniref:Uncharacterized protein n=1 Tax=marine sediment metagenome TaxID=412755 RepID=X0W6R5_9ZZZZ
MRETEETPGMIKLSGIDEVSQSRFHRASQRNDDRVSDSSQLHCEEIQIANERELRAIDGAEPV